MIKQKPETRSEKSKRVGQLFRVLKLTYPDVHCTLDRVSPEQFLLAAILSPQCTDVIANNVSRALWKAFPTLEKIDDARLSDIEKILKPCGMYHVKSRYIKDTAHKLISECHGQVPSSLSALMSFPGVGRKVALVVLLEVFGTVDGIIIDTHNIRLAHRLRLSSSKDAATIEKDLMQTVPKQYWSLWSHLMVFHGRSYCTARSPRCSVCPIRTYCPYDQKAL